MLKALASPVHRRARPLAFRRAPLLFLLLAAGSQGRAGAQAPASGPAPARSVRPQLLSPDALRAKLKAREAREAKETKETKDAKASNPAPVAAPAVAPPATAAARGQLLDKLEVQPVASVRKARPVVELAHPAVLGSVKTKEPEIEVPLRLDRVQLGGLRAYTMEAGGLSAAPGALKQNGEVPSVAVPRNRSLVLAPDPGATRDVPLSRLTQEKSSFPGVILRTTELGGGARRLQKMELTMRAAFTPMRWQPDRGQYATQLIVGIDGEGGQAPLDREIVVQFAGENVVADPPQVAISQAGTQGYRRVSLMTAVHTPTPRVKAYSDLGPLVHEIALEPQLAKLVVTPSASRILAFGLESATVTVAGFAEDGREIQSPAPVPVNLSASSGRLDPPRVMLLAALPAREAKLTSSSVALGLVEVVASSGAIASPPVRMELAFPWGLFLCVLLAGSLGGFFAYRRRQQRAGSAHPRLIVEGALVGLVLVIAVLAGVPLLRMEGLVQQDLGRFTIAFVFGFIGRPAIEMLAGAVAKAPETSDAAAGDAVAGRKNKKKRRLPEPPAEAATKDDQEGESNRRA
jgi:hypothetical protein